MIGIGRDLIAAASHKRILLSLVFIVARGAARLVGALISRSGSSELVLLEDGVVRVLVLELHASVVLEVAFNANFEVFTLISNARVHRFTFRDLFSAVGALSSF